MMRECPNCKGEVRLLLHLNDEGDFYRMLKCPRCGHITKNKLEEWMTIKQTLSFQVLKKTSILFNKGFIVKQGVKK